MVRIKVCGMRDADNIREVGALKPDYMGFIFYPGSKRYFGTNYKIIRQTDSGIKKAGVFVNEDPRSILEIASLGRLDILQLHGTEPPSVCELLKNNGFTVIKSFGVDENFDFSLLRVYQGNCDYFLFDAKTPYHGGSGQKFNWDLINPSKIKTPFFLSGGIGPNDAEAIKSLSDNSFYCIDINSRFETSPGMKDIGLLKKFINELRMH